MAILREPQAQGIEGLDWRDKLYAAYCNLGDEFLANGQREDAARQFEQADQVDPSRGEARATLTALTPTPLPTPTPVLPVLVTLDGDFIRTLYLGDKQLFTLTVTNLGGQPILGFKIIADGPWDKFTRSSVTGGQWVDGFLFFPPSVVSEDAVIPAGKSFTVTITCYPNEPGNHDFRFRLRDLKDNDIPHLPGDSLILGGNVEVIRRR